MYWENHGEKPVTFGILGTVMMAEFNLVRLLFTETAPTQHDCLYRKSCQHPTTTEDYHFNTSRTYNL